MDVYNAALYERAGRLATQALNLLRALDNGQGVERSLMFCAIFLQSFASASSHREEVWMSTGRIVRQGRELMEDLDLLRAPIPSKRPAMRAGSSSVTEQVKESLSRLFDVSELILSIDGDEEVAAGTIIKVESWTFASFV